ncbi:MAG: AgmX/PglI C-terminal domain-containing protein [Persicimonas sp.]
MSKKPAHKILRIGLIQNGKILEERLMRAAKPVTIGHGLKKNVLVVPASNLPKTYKLFEPVDGNYQLFFTSKMSGRVSLGDGVHTLDELISSGKVKKSGNGYVLRLNSRARGKITFGEVTVLFQFVSPPPPRPKPVLPASMRGGWLKGIEPFLAAVIALSAILQIGFVAYVELQDWPEELDANMKVEDRFVKIMADKEEVEPPEEPEEEEPQEDGEGEAEPDEEQAKPEPQPKKEPEEKKDDKPKTAEERAEAEAERRKRMAEKVEKSTILHQIGSRSEDGGSLADSLSEGAGKTSMDDAFDGSKGMKRGELGAEKSGLDTSGSSDAEGTGSASDIDDLGESSGARAAKEGVDTGEKDEVEVKASVDVKGSSQTVGSGKLDANRISRVVQRGASAIQRCFERELKKNPDVGGKLVITVTIGRAGKVTQVNTNTGIGGQFPTCAKTAINRWRFPRPKGGDVSFTKTFVLQSSN